MSRFTLITGSAGVGKSTLARSIPLDKHILFACGGEIRNAHPHTLLASVTHENAKNIGKFLFRSDIQEFIKQNNLIVVLDSLTELHNDLTNQIYAMKGAPDLRTWGTDRSQPIKTLVMDLKALASYVPVFATIGHSYYKASKDDPVAGYKIDFGNFDEDILYECDAILAVYKGAKGRQILSAYSDTQRMPGYSPDEPEGRMYERKFRNIMDQYTSEEIRMTELEKPAMIDGAAARYNFMYQYLKYSGYYKDAGDWLDFSESDTEEFKKQRDAEFARAKELKSQFDIIKSRK